jgi:hypothetical protein
MKDVFYTLLVVWVVWRIIEGVNTMRAKGPNQTPSGRKMGDTTISYMPPEANKKKISDEAGEYVDYEEVK